MVLADAVGVGGKHEARLRLTPDSAVHLAPGLNYAHLLVWIPGLLLAWNVYHPIAIAPSNNSVSWRNSMSWYGPCIAAGLTIALPESAALKHARPEDKSCKIVVGRNTAITDNRDRFGIAFEPSIAVNPKDPLNLIAGVWFAGASEGEGSSPTYSDIKIETYSSRDGGRSWQAMSWPRTVAGEMFLRRSGRHPMVSFNRDGEGFILANFLPTFSGDPSSQSSQVTEVSQTIIGKTIRGRYWEMAGTLGDNNGEIDSSDIGYRDGDGMRMAMDRTLGVGNGNIYVVANMGNFKEGIGFFIIPPNGKKWIQRTSYGHSSLIDNKLSVPSGTFHSYASLPILQSRSGKIILPIAAYKASHIMPNVSTPKSWLYETADKGRSFTGPFPVVDSKGQQLRGTENDNFTAYAIDNSGNSFNDRIYRVWAAETKDPTKFELLFSFSDDARKWSDPRVIEVLENPDSAMKGGSYVQPQSQPLVAVNKDGIVLISWYRFRKLDGASLPEHQRVAAASANGGADFTSVTAVASAPTRNFINNGVYRAIHKTEVAKFSTNLNGDLGHYLTMTSDSMGKFNLAWLDGRRGRQELWYAPVNVECKTRRRKRV